jgi:hypothetical protein
MVLAIVLGSLSTASARYYRPYDHRVRAAPVRAWGGPPVIVTRRVYMPSYGYGYGYYGYRSNWMSRASQSRDGGW